MTLRRQASRIAVVCMILLGQAASVHAAEPLRDPELPSVKPEALQQLSDGRIRQQIMQASQAGYPGRCVCPYQTQDAKGRSCKGRHEVVASRPRPICYPKDVTQAMIDDWRQRNGN